MDLNAFQSEPTESGLKIVLHSGLSIGASLLFWLMMIALLTTPAWLPAVLNRLVQP